MNSSILFRPGYFFTLIFASALTGSSALPLLMPDLFTLSVSSAVAILLVGIIVGMGVLLRWPTARLLAIAYLLLILVVSVWFVFTGAPVARISWGIFGSVIAGLLGIVLLSGTIRTYESNR